MSFRSIGEKALEPEPNEDLINFTIPEDEATDGIVEIKPVDWQPPPAAAGGETARVAKGPGKILRRSSSAGEGLDKRLSKEVEDTISEKYNLQEPRPRSVQDFEIRKDFVIKQREKWLLDICDETEFDRRNKLRTIRLCSYNLGFLLIVWSGFIVTGLLLIRKSHSMQTSLIDQLRTHYQNQVLYLDIKLLKLFVDATNMNTIGQLLIAVAAVTALITLLHRLIVNPGGEKPICSGTVSRTADVLRAIRVYDYSSLIPSRFRRSSPRVRLIRKSSIEAAIEEHEKNILS